MSVDWRLGLAPDDLGPSVAQAFQTGRALAKQNALESAYRTFASDPAAGAKAVTAIDPVMGNQLTTDANAQHDRQSSLDVSSALAKGDQTGAITAAGTLPADQMLAVQQHIASLDESHRKLAADTNEKLAGVLHGLSTVQDVSERLRMAQHIAAQHPELGLAADKITADDVSDQGIQAHLNTAMTLKDLLAREDKANETLIVPEGGSVFTKGQFAGAAPVSDNATPAPAAAAAPAAPGGEGQPISVRQNNPGNLRSLPDGQLWAGQTGEANGFAVFSDPTAGAAAAEKNLIAKQTRHGLTTLTQIIGDPHWGWAPAADHNDPAAYAATVGQAVGVDPNAPIDLVHNADLRQKVLHAMFGVEGGGTPSPQPTSHAAAPQAAQAPAGPRPIYTAPRNGGHASTAAEIAAAGLPAGTAAWTNKDGKPEPYPDSLQSHAPGAGSDLTGEDFLKTLPKGYAAQIKGYANGDIAMPSGNRAGSRDQQRLLNDIMQYDPSASAANLASRTAIRKAFTSGPYSQTINATNTVIGHIGDLDRAIDKLNNTGIPMWNKTAQAFGENLGNTDTQKSLASFNTYKTMVANELTKVYRGTGGAEADIQGWMKQLDAASSPAALKATVKAMVTGLKSRIDSLGVTYSQGMGKTTDPFTLLTPRAKTVFERLYGSGEDDGSAPASNSGQGWKVIAVH